MANDALKRLVKKNRDFTSPNPKLEQSRVSLAEGGELIPEVPVTSDDPQMEAMARAQAPVTQAISNQIAEDYANRLTYEDAVKAAKGDPQAQAKVHEKSLGAAVGSLNMNPLNRAVRAEKMGFGPDVYYHGTKGSNLKSKESIVEFDPSKSKQGVAGFFTKDPKFASNFAPGKFDENAAEYVANGQQVIPAYLKVKNAFDYENPKHVKALVESFSKADRSKLMGPDFRKFQDAIESGRWPVLEQKQILEKIKSLGHDAVHVTEGGRKNIAVFEPSQIRSQFAEFDPSKKSSGNISYADGGPVEPQGQMTPVSPDTINYDQIQQQEAPSGPQGNINVITPENELVSIEPKHLDSALSTGWRIPTPEEENKHLNEAEFGTPGQQAITALEGAAESASLGTSTGMERALGLSTPKRITARRETNPLSHAAGQVAGLAASSLIPVAGEANLLRAGGMGLAKAAGLTGAGVVEQIGANAIKGAFEMALLQGGSEISKGFAEDPNQTAESAIADIGLSTVMGGVFGGAIGAALQSAKRVSQPLKQVVSELDRPGMEAGTFESAVKGSGLFKPSESEGILASLGKAKKDAPEITAAAERLGAPVMEGMVSDSKLVQKAEDALINGVPTYSGIKRQELYKQGFQKASQAADQALGEGSTHSKAELGKLIKDGLTFSLEEQNAPIQGMYDALKASHSVIPLAEDAGESVLKDLKGIQELKLSPSSPEGQLARRTISEIENLKTVDDVKSYKSILNRSVSPTASSGEKRMAAVISDKLRQLEEDSIESFARKQGNPEIQALIPQRKIANAEYKQLIDKVQTLSEQLGKGRIHGVQDAIHFIQDKLTPEEVTGRLFSKNNSEFLKFFQKEFPEQMDLMRQYQKSALREEASRTGELSPKLLFNKINKLEPEVKEALFSPAELQQLSDSETYIRAMPKNFNPSGTAHMDAMRSFFEHPMGAAMANVRDLGLDKFIKLVSASPEINQAISLAKSAVKGEKAAAKGIKDIFNHELPPMRGVEHASASDRSKLDKMVSQYVSNPEKMMEIGDSNPVPEFSQAFSAAAARAVQYLAPLKPDAAPRAPLDTRMPASDVKKAAYDRALTTASNPLSILNRIKDSTLTVSDVQALNAIYPNLYKKLSTGIQQKIVESVAAGKPIPYQTRISLSKFLGEPLDSTLTQVGILGAQAQSGQQQQGQQQAPEQGAGPKKSTSSLSKLPQGYATANQTREARRQKP